MLIFRNSLLNIVYCNIFAIWIASLHQYLMFVSRINIPGVHLLLMDGGGILTCLLFVANSLVLAIIGAGRVCKGTCIQDWPLP